MPLYSNLVAAITDVQVEDPSVAAISEFALEIVKLGNVLDDQSSLNGHVEELCGSWALPLLYEKIQTKLISTAFA